MKGKHAGLYKRDPDLDLVKLPFQEQNRFDNFLEAKEMKGVEMLDIHSDSVSAREWRDKLRKETAGKTAKEVRGILTNYPEIENVLDIKMSPFWAESLPTIFDRIEFEIQ